METKTYEEKLIEPGLVLKLEDIKDMKLCFNSEDLIYANLMQPEPTKIVYLYLLTQNQNNDWDTYDAMIVAAESEEEARKIHPDRNIFDNDDEKAWKFYKDSYSTWANNSDHVKVKLLGMAHSGVEKGIILKSFGAGNNLNIK